LPPGSSTIGRAVRSNSPAQVVTICGVIGLLYRAGDVLRRRALGRDTGRIGEDMAHRYLRARGLTVVARNYRTRSGSGEIDIVAWDREVLVFVEVKTRASAEFGAPERAVDREKSLRLQRAARDYARRANVEWDKTRFDIVSIVLAAQPEIEWMRNAFR
jgi:putative endonuclease